MKKIPAKPTSYVSLDETSRALLDSAVESAYVMDVSGYVLAANDMAAKQFDLEKGRDLEQCNIYDLLPPETAEIRREKVQEAIDSVKKVNFEEEVLGKSLFHSIVPVSNPWGEVGRLTISTLDKTELRRTDEGLRREQQRQIFFMESLPGIVYHLYPDKSIRYANRYFRKYLGSPKGKICAEALHCCEDACDGCPPMEAMETDRAVEWDWTDNKGRTFHLQCSPMTDSAGERMIMVLGIDITARKRAEDELKRAHDKLEDRVRQRTKELEKANTELTQKSMRLVSAMKKADSATRAKSAFLANMSHEIRTPLNAVLGMAELSLLTEEADKKNHYLKRVKEAGHTLLSVINDILDFSKIEARKLTLETIDFDLRSVLEAALDIHSMTVMEKGLDLSYKVEPNVPEVLQGDPSRLKQVLINLLSNAVKFTEKGGVDVSVALLSSEEMANPGDRVVLEFSVTDTGIGIPEDKQEDVFKSFLQADDSITRKHGGTGLGLAICTLLVELMDGRLHLSSVEGEGSTFSFTATLAVGDASKLQAEERARRVDQSITMPKLKVLLADDNELNRQLASTLLEEQGHQCVKVENGALALEALKTEHFDVVLMDVQMPVMDGVSATRAIRTPNSGVLSPDIPIVALTAHALMGDRERFLEAGMTDYIAKPIKIDEFYSTLARVVLGREVKQKKRAVAAKKEVASETFDRQTALDMLGGRKDLLTRMDEIFIRDVPGELEDLRNNINDMHWEDAQRMAHSIKGSSRTVGASRCGAVAEQMEFFCRQRDGVSASKELKTLESEVESALTFIRTDTQ
ncbi:PAS/PAC sensor signal transduction histidine kinase (Modular protein) [Pseudodesulfovibrio profundus]|uniref:histidine kinase n=1 Tax=Pseudodesulfovibrio profundus TaxID=57320 RepID=A0A2C8F9H4_9BACT|nr:ATP-binding protein [Pseudodesulfovibrio profundus]SOB59200.1 PAS/PAC sensor signal transduction histidine kinase (Modular protein) [Pseudodesulfovibrio profundus]